MPVQIASASAIAVLLAGLYAPVQTGETPLFTRCAKVNLRVDAPTGLEEDVIRSRVRLFFVEGFFAYS